MSSDGGDDSGEKHDEKKARIENDLGTMDSLSSTTVNGFQLQHLLLAVQTFEPAFVSLRITLATPLTKILDDYESIHGNDVPTPANTFVTGNHGTPFLPKAPTTPEEWQSSEDEDLGNAPIDRSCWAPSTTRRQIPPRMPVL